MSVGVWLLLPRPEPDLTELRAIRFDETYTFQRAQEALMLNYNLLMDVSLPNSSLQERIDQEYLTSWYKSNQEAAVKKELLLQN